MSETFLSETLRVGSTKIPVPIIAVGTGIVLFGVIQLLRSRGQAAVMETTLPTAETPIPFGASSDLTAELSQSFANQLAATRAALEAQLTSSRGEFGTSVSSLGGQISQLSNRFTTESAALRQEQAAALRQFRTEMLGQAQQGSTFLTTRVAQVEESERLNRARFSLLAQTLAGLWQYVSFTSPQSNQAWSRSVSALLQSASKVPPTQAESDAIRQMQIDYNSYLR